MLSPKKRKTPVQKQLRMKPEKVLFYTISLFLFSSIVTTVYLYFWILFQFCGLILYFFVCVSGWGMLISVLGFVFLFSGSVFLFWVSVLSMCFCFGFVLSYFCCCCCCLVVFLFLSATLYI